LPIIKSKQRELMMDTYNKPGNKPNRIHPLVAGAAISVMLASLTGVAAMTGLLPNSHSENKAAAEAAQPQAAQSSTTKPAAVAKTPKAVSSDRLALKEDDQALAPRQQQAASLSA